MKIKLSIIAVSICIMSFHGCTKEPQPPVLTTNEVTGITTFSALSGGAITSDGEASVSSKGICWSTAEKPTIADTKTTEKTTASFFNSDLTQLLPKTKYYVRAYATNIAGTGYGPEISFTTLGNQPGANTSSATNIQTSSATISGSVNPFLLPTTVAFEWGTSSNYGNTLSGSENPIDGNTPVTLSVNLTDLSPGTTYHFRIKAENSLGITYSTESTFRTLGAVPSVHINDASNIGTSSAMMHGSVNPNHLQTVVSFEWGTSSSYGNTVSASQSPVTGNTPGNISANLTDLSPGITYHFRIKAENSLGITYSNESTFKTLGAVPSVHINDGSNIGLSSAMMNGSVNPNHLQTIVSFDWGTSSSYGNTVSAIQSPVTGSTAVNLSANLTGLSPGKTYHFRIKAENSLGVTLSVDKTFKTLGDPPTAEPKPAINLQYNSATIKGHVNPNHFASSVVFEWGETALYGNIAPVSLSPITGSQFVDISADITGLDQGTTYHFRIRAENDLGTTYSNDLTFTSLAPITDYEGNTYNIRSFGTQVWMTENLKSTKYPDGTPIAYGLYNPGNNISHVAKRGYLYSWSAVIKQPQRYDTIMLDVQGQRIQGVCPTNWHLPTEAEWMVLIDSYGGKAVAGLKLKIANPGYWSEPLAIEAPLSGFNAIPGGMRHTDGWYLSEMDNAKYWTTTQHFMGGSIMGRHVDIMSFNPNITTNYTNTNNVPGSFGQSVRCIRDY